MEHKYILGIDCGTGSVKVMIVGRDGVQAAFEKSPLNTLKPEEGYAEQDPLHIWETVHELIRKALSKDSIMPGQIAAIGIANQRATSIVWNKKTGIPYCNAVLWTDKRATDISERAVSERMDSRVVERVGMYTIPNTSAMLLTWLLENEDLVIEGVKKGDAAFGTVNSWLLWKLTGGKVHFSDFANMSVTQLQNAKELDYDWEVLDYLKIPQRILPELKSTGEIYGFTDRKLFSGCRIPIAGMLGDQMAATLGQGCIKNGMVKVTYGTGCFCVMNSGRKYTPPAGGLFSPILWGDKKKPTYGLEGFFEIDGERTDNSFLDGIAYQTADIIKNMEVITGQDITVLRVDGGMANNDHLVQALADILGIPIERPTVSEATVLGAIYQAGLTVGFWRTIEETGSLWKLGRRFEPNLSAMKRKERSPGGLKIPEGRQSDKSEMGDDIDIRLAEGIRLANIGFYSYAFDGTVLSMDRVAFDFFELEGIFESPQSVIGQNIESLFVYTGPKGRIRHEIAARGRVSNFEYGIRTLKNSEKWGIHNSYAYIDKKSGKEAIQVCFYEITDHKLHEKERIEQSEQRYKALFEHSPDSILILDLKGTITECNKATTGLLELKYENIIGRKFDELEILDKAQAFRCMNMFNSMTTGENTDAIELEITGGNGSSRWIELFPHALLRNGNTIGIQIISRNITERKLAEIELRKKVMKFELNHGNVYLSKESKPRQSMEAFMELLTVGYSGTAISRRSKSEYKDILGSAFRHVKISEMGRDSHVLPRYRAIHDLMAGLPRGEVVHIDCVEYLMSRLGSKKTLNLIQYLGDLAKSKNLCVLISADPVALSDLDMRLIEKESKVILPSRSLAGLSEKLIETLTYIDKSNNARKMPSYSDIGKELNLSKPTTRKRVTELLELGVVSEIQRGREKALKITEKGKNYLAS